MDSSLGGSDDPNQQGFDGAVEFEPCFHDLPEPTVRQRLLSAYGRRLGGWSGTIIGYEELAARAMARASPGWLRWPGLTPGFDNTPRRRHNALIVEKSDPRVYERWLRHAYDQSERLRQERAQIERGLVFVNAWNEWAEGNYLEPDAHSGRAYLEAHRRVMQAWGKLDDGSALRRQTAL